MGWFLIIATSVSLVIALYIGFRTISLFNGQTTGYFNSIGKILFWLIILIGALSFMISRILNPISDYYLPLIANLSFSLILCLLYSVIIIDILRLILKFFAKKTGKPSYKLQLLYLVMAFSLFFCGLYMASVPRINEYPITIDKKAKVKHLKIVQLSDIHISETTSTHFIRNMVDNVNKLNADYIFITGDTLDLRLKPYIDKQFDQLFAQLQSRYGTFIILGNHEHYGIKRKENNSLQDVISAFESGKMTVLRDQIFYDDKTGVTLIGRDDYAVNDNTQKRMALSRLLEGVNQEQPVILLDHQPRNLAEPSDLGIDIMFSGHTHAGQVFPLNLLVSLMYQNPFGIYDLRNQKDHSFTSLVSSGYGLWGPPLRLMTRAEIVVTDVTFN